MDAWAGGLIDELKEAGLYENTIIFFWSDHGVGLPRAKRWLYDSGTRIPLIVRIPKSLRDDDQGKPNTVDDRLVCSVDFAPTVLNLAGVPIPNKLQGQPFLGTKLPPKRKHVFGARDRMDERYDIIRTVRDQRFRYVRNFEPLKPYYQYMNTPEKGATMIEIRRAEQSGNLTETMAVFSAATKPAEELYDLENDFHEVNNLADNPEHAGKLAEMRTALKDWQNEIGDVGLIPEAEIEIEEKQAGSRYDILHDRPDSAQLLERLVTIATQASSGPDQLDDLIAGLQDENASVRYWSATGIGNIGPDVATAQAANQTRTAIKRCLTDTSPSVRIAAARAIARLGNPTAAIKILQQELVSDHQWGRLAAAIVLDEMDDEAKPATDALQGALKDQPNKYIVRVANRALNEMQGTNNQVP
jgi:uncharacterized sulfatase